MSVKILKQKEQANFTDEELRVMECASELCDELFGVINSFVERLTANDSDFVRKYSIGMVSSSLVKAVAIVCLSAPTKEIRDEAMENIFTTIRASVASAEEVIDGERNDV